MYLKIIGLFGLGLTFVMPAAAQNESSQMILLDGPQAKLIGKGVAIREGYIRNWDGLNSGPEWKFKSETAGSYDLWLFCASPKTEGGKLKLILDAEKGVVANVPETRDFNDFQLFKMGSFDLPKGPHTLKVISESLQKTYLMDIKYAVWCANKNADAAVIAAWVEYEKTKVERAFAQNKTFTDAVCAARKLFIEDAGPDMRKRVLKIMWDRYPHQMVWLEQDMQDKPETFLENPNTQTAFDTLIQNLLKTTPDSIRYQTEYDALKAKTAAPDESAFITFYDKTARVRRAERLNRIRQHGNEIIFAKHHVFASRSGIYLITETEGSPLPNMLCSVDLKKETDGAFAPTEVLFDPGEGMVRDPELSFDAKRLLFAMRPTKEFFNSTYATETAGIPRMNYQIYEMNLEDKSFRALTDTETYGSSFEPCYLPNDDIMFSSARIVQHITCGWGDCSNLFIMNKDGKYARRVGFDQTNTAFPALLDDGRVIFTRRDYNDRGQSSAHALFQMNPDGTGQTAFYGNQTGTPNSFHHARGIPNSPKVITIIGGYHTTQGGKLAIMDVRKGVEKAQGILQLPGYTTPISSDGYDDDYGKWGVQYANPRALTETDYLVSIAPDKSSHYRLYYMNDMGEREILSADSRVSCLQPLLKAERKRPQVRPPLPDYTKDNGVFYVQNVYYGAAAEGIKPGTVKKLRVIEMIFKNSTIGSGSARGPGGCWDTVTSTGNGLGSFDAKRIIGDADVYEDGSAMFFSPARKPVYFQLLDENNRVVQTMRSWATLMPGENFSCVGCHEDKVNTPLNMTKKTTAFTKGPQELQLFYGKPRAFRYMNEVQPTFDKHCISCHKPDGKAKHLLLTAEPFLNDPSIKRKFARSYFELTKARPENAHQPEDFTFGNPLWARNGKRQADEPNRYISWWTRFELMGPQKPYRSGSIRSGLVQTLEKGHQGVKLSNEELDKIRAWIDLNIPFAGEYDDDHLWSFKEQKLYRERDDERRRNESIESRNIREYIRDGQP